MQSGGASFQGSVPSTGWQRGEQVVAGVGYICQDALCSTEAASPEDVLQGEQGESNYFLSSFDNSLEVFLVCLYTVSIPGCQTLLWVLAYKFICYAIELMKFELN